jgi:hypothetical protein
VEIGTEEARLHIYRRACAGVWPGPQIRTARQDSIRKKWSGKPATDPKTSSPAAGLTCGEHLHSHV